MHHRPLPSRRLGTILRFQGAAVLAAAAGLVAVSGATSAPAAGASSRAPGSSASGSCANVSGTHHARVVVESSAKHVVERCVGFSGKKIPALELLKDSHIQLGTQTYSYGVAICQVDHVPSHYSQCLASGQDYWAVFLSNRGRAWTTPSVGVSEISVPPGGSLGLRYDSPTGTPAPPPKPSPA